jgi:inner membrane protein
VSFKDLYLPATLGWGTHGLLDSCTSYGTYLYWPFSSERVAWHIISIVDPLFTLPLLVGVLWAVRTRSAQITRVFLATALAYLGFGAFQLHRAESVYEAVIAERGHEATRVEVKPSLGNNVLFRAFYEHDGHYYADAVRVTWLGNPTIYPGSHHPVLDLPDYIATHQLDALRQEDISRFEYFSAGYLVEDPRHPGVISDFRYAAVPNDIAPMWGIDVLGTPSGEHTEWLHFREIEENDRVRFLDMIRGK